MKWLLFFIVLFLFPAVYIGKSEFPRHFTNAKIAKSPEFTVGYFDSVDDGILDDRYRYKYRVEGKEYYVHSSSQTITPESLLKNAVVEIAYSGTDPSTSTLKVFYDKRHETGGLGRSIFLVIVLSVLLALPVWLFVALLFWLNRKLKPKYA